MLFVSEEVLVMGGAVGENVIVACPVHLPTARASIWWNLSVGAADCPAVVTVAFSADGMLVDCPSATWATPQLLSTARMKCFMGLAI
jgi:hypothetical protein